MDAAVGGDSIGKENRMLWTLALILLVLWALGLMTGFTMSGFIHVLIVIAVAAVLIRIITGRRAV